MDFSVRLAVVIYVGFLLAGSLLVYRDQAVAFSPRTEPDMQLFTPSDDAQAIDEPLAPRDDAPAWRRGDDTAASESPAADQAR